MFSKNRAAQLDLLLRSIEQNAPGLYSRVHVIWKGDGAYADAYRVCEREHEWAELVEETDLRQQTLEILDDADWCVTTFCDDDVVYRPIVPDIAEWLLGRPELVCLSLRLGANTTYCYSLDCTQRVPVGDWTQECVAWDWPDEECDFSYPGSLDAHLWRADEFTEFVEGDSWRNPNQLEEQLQRSLLERARHRPLAALRESCVVGLPVNLVNETHPNRHGVAHYRSPEELNARFLVGDRLDLRSIDPSAVHSAHTEANLRWKPAVPA